MYAQVEKPKENKRRAVANTVTQKKSKGNQTFGFVDKRAEAIVQRKLEDMAHNSPQVKQTAQLQTMIDNRFTQQQPLIQKKENKTGLPDNLKSGIENLSGYSMDDVKVHYNSDKPAQLNAHAYAQGTDIHIASGQEKHLPHEAWHVAQQKQGKVQPTMQMKGGVNVNDSPGLEKEADMMGKKALQMKLEENKSRAATNSVTQKKSNVKQGYVVLDNRTEAIAQRKLQEMANRSPRVLPSSTIQRLIDVQDKKHTQNGLQPRMTVQLTRLADDETPADGPDPEAREIEWWRRNPYILDDQNIWRRVTREMVNNQRGERGEDHQIDVALLRTGVRKVYRAGESRTFRINNTANFLKIVFNYNYGMVVTAYYLNDNAAKRDVLGREATDVAWGVKKEQLPIVG